MCSKTPTAGRDVPATRPRSQTSRGCQYSLGVGLVGVIGDAGSILQYPLLHFLLALAAVTRPRHRVEPLGIDLASARNALANNAPMDALQGFLDHLQVALLLRARAEQELLGLIAGG